MKNKYKLLYISIFSILMIALFLYLNNKIYGAKTIECPYLQQVTFSDIKKSINNKDTFILYIGKKGCPACQMFEPRIKNVLNKYKVYVKYMDFSTLTSDEKHEFDQIATITGTPTVLFINKGVEEYSKNRIEGAVSKSDIIQILQDNNYIKK